MDALINFAINYPNIKVLSFVSIDRVLSCLILSPPFVPRCSDNIHQCPRSSKPPRYAFKQEEIQTIGLYTDQKP